MSEQAKHLAIRQNRLEQLLLQANRFKVCEQCRSISFKHASTCSVCGAYRFNEDSRAVRATAKEMAANAFPTTSGTVPRM